MNNARKSGVIHFPGVNNAWKSGVINAPGVIRVGVKSCHLQSHIFSKNIQNKTTQSVSESLPKMFPNKTTHSVSNILGKYLNETAHSVLYRFEKFVK